MRIANAFFRGHVLSGVGGSRPRREARRIDEEAWLHTSNLHVGEPSTAVDWDESREGHHLRFGSQGQLVGLTILNARRILEDDGKIVITLPERRLETSDLGDVLAPA